LPLLATDKKTAKKRKFSEKKGGYGRASRFTNKKSWKIDDLPGNHPRL